MARLKREVDRLEQKNASLKKVAVLHERIEVRHNKKNIQLAV